MAPCIHLAICLKRATAACLWDVLLTLQNSYVATFKRKLEQSKHGISKVMQQMQMQKQQQQQQHQQQPQQPQPHMQQPAMPPYPPQQQPQHSMPQQQQHPQVPGMSAGMSHNQTALSQQQMVGLHSDT